MGWVNPDEVGCLAVVWSGVCRFLLSPSFGGSLDTLILSFMLLAPAGSGGAIGVVVVVGPRVGGEKFLLVIKVEWSRCGRGFSTRFVQECLKGHFLPSQVVGKVGAGAWSSYSLLKVPWSGSKESQSWSSDRGLELRATPVKIRNVKTCHRIFPTYSSFSRKY